MNGKLECQIVSINKNNTAAILASKLVGTGLKVQNASLLCNSDAHASIINTSNSTLGINNGILLSTGKVDSITGSNVLLASRNNGINTQDPQIASLTALTQYDLCRLEFEVIPLGDTVRLRYQFASEEYPEYNCTNYSDVFGVFVSGNGISGGFQNFAKIPNTNINVSVNSINDSTTTSGNYSVCNALGPGSPFKQYYIKNTTSFYRFNGFTKILEATIPVIPNNIYQMKLAISDISDTSTDSGIFFEEGSLYSAPIIEVRAVSSDQTNNKPITAIESCNNASIRVVRPKNNKPLTVAITTGGNAILSSDYTLSQTNSLNFAAGDTATTVFFSALKDNFSESNDSAIIRFSADGVTDSAVIYLKDYLPGFSVFNASNDTTICVGNSVNLRVQNLPTNASFSWIPSSNLDNPFVSSPNFIPPSINSIQSYSYIFRHQISGCPVRDSTINITVQPGPQITFSSNELRKCSNDTITLTPNIAPVGIYTYSWSPSTQLINGNTATPQTFSNANRTYKLTVSSSAGCTDTDSVMVIPTNTRSELTTLSANATSCGLNNGSILIFNNGSNPPYTVSINNGPQINTSLLSGLAPNSYSVRIRNGSNCIFDTTMVISAGPLGPTVSTSVIHTKCGKNNGSVKANATGGKLPYSFLWNNGANGWDSIANLSSGVYIVTTTDANGCSVVSQVSVLSSLAVSVNFTTTHTSCNLSNGSIISNVVNASPPFTFDWSNGSSSQNLSNLSANKYILNFQDSNGCTYKDSLSILPSSDLILSKKYKNTTCNQPNGWIKYSIVSGVPPITYQWSNGASTDSIGALLPGVYRITATDSKLCTYTDSVEILSSSILQATIVDRQPTCGQKNGVVRVASISNGKAPYSYLWSNSSTIDSTGLVNEGTYSVTITDSNNCIYTESRILTNNSNPQLSLTKKNDKCSISQGSVSSLVSGGVEPYSYVWSNDSTRSSIENLAAGIYILTITDQVGCIRIDTAIITNTPSVSATHLIHQPTCDSSNGYIALSNITGIQPFTIRWNDNSNNDTLLNIPSGTYRVNIRDSMGCTFNGKYTIPKNNIPEITFDTKNAHCDSTTGSILTTVTGGILPYQYLWSNGSNANSLTAVPHSTKYTLSVTDAAGCTIVKTDSLIYTPKPSFTDSTLLINCYNKSDAYIYILNIESVYPYSVNWEAESNALYPYNKRNLSEGTYTFKITDSLGCVVSKTYDVIKRTSPTLTVTNVRPNCNVNNGSISANIIGGESPYSISWTRSIITSFNPFKDTTIDLPDTTLALSNLPASTYTLKVVDKNQCEVISISNLSAKDTIKYQIDTSHTTCKNPIGSILITQLTPLPRFRYIWVGYSVDTNFRDSLGEGLYRVIIQDTNSGCYSDTSIQIDLPYKLKVTIDSNANTFCGLDNGYIRIKIDSNSSPAPVLTYWNEALLNQTTQSNLTPGFYTIKVVDTNECIAQVESEILKTPFFRTKKSVTSTHCNLADGMIHIEYLSEDSSVFPISTVWNTGQTGPLLLNISNGTYIATHTDAKGCIARDTIVVENLASEIDSIIAVNPNCNQNNGSIELVFTAPNDIDSIIWNNTPLLDAAKINTLDSGTYTVKVFTNKGCIYFDTIRLNRTPMLRLTASIYPSKCIDGFGSIKITPSFGSPPYLFEWSNFSESDSLYSLSSGLYNLTLTDNDNCIIDTTFSIDVSPTPKISLFTKNDICTRGQGEITAFVSNASFPISYNWSNGSNFFRIMNLSAGKYFVTVTDRYGCTSVDSATVVSTPAIVSSINVQQAKCNLNNGSATVTTSGGLGAYQYQWSNGSTSPSIFNLNSGSYILTTRDSVNCIHRDTVQITRIVGPSINMTKEDETCSYQNGSITAIINNPAPPLSILWSHNPSSTALTQSNLSSGLYSLNVQDANGCNISNSIVVNNQAGPTTTISNINANCGLNNGKIIANVFGSNTPFQYYWNNIPSTSLILNNVNGGTFYFKVTDSKGCQKIDTIIRPTISAPSIAFSTIPPNCNLNNGTIKASPSGFNPPLVYSWSNGLSADSITNLNSGTYTLTVSDANQCQKSDSVNLIRVSPHIVIMSISNTICENNNGSATANVFGGAPPFTYLWSTGETTNTITAKSHGIYTLSVTDALKCTVNQTANIQTTGISQVLKSIDTPTCVRNNGKIILNPIGGVAPYSYSWSNGATSNQITSIDTGIFYVTITDFNSCKFYDTIDLRRRQSPKISVVATLPKCGLPNGSIVAQSATGKGPLTYFWSHNPALFSNTALNLQASSYTIIAQDANLCRDTMIYNLVAKPDIIVQDSVVKTICGSSDGKIYLKISGGVGRVSMIWSNGDTLPYRTNLSAGIYTATFSDTDQCIKTLNFILPDIPKPTLSPVLSSPVCGVNNGYINAAIEPNTGTYPFSFSWRNLPNTDSFIQNLGYGEYTVLVIDANGCQDSATLNFPIATEPRIALTPTHVVCSRSDGKVFLTSSRLVEPISYLWSTGSTADSITNLMPGMYSVTVTDNRGCVIKDSAKVNDQPGPIISNFDITKPYCGQPSGVVKVNYSLGTQPIQYSWSNGSNIQTIFNVPKGSYSVTLTDINNCITSGNVTIDDEPDNLTIDTIITSNPKCYGESNGQILVVAKNGNEPYFYQINGSILNRTNPIVNLGPGKYVVRVQDAKGCFRIDSVTLTAPSPIAASIVQKKNVDCYNASTGSLTASASGGTPPYRYYWPSINQWTDHPTGLKAGIYSVNVIDQNNCYITISDTITQPLNLQLVNPTIKHPLCADSASGSIKLSAIGASAPYSYTWSNGTTLRNLSNVPAGTYTLSVTDSKGCVFPFDFKLVDPPPLKFAELDVVDIPCIELGQNIIIKAQGGQGPPYQYSIYGNTRYSDSSRFDYLDAGIYSVWIKDSNQCTANQTVNILNNVNLKIAAKPKQITLDVGESITLSYDILYGVPSLINKTQWLNQGALSCSYCQTTTATPHTSGPYVVQVHYNDNYCLSSDTVWVTIRNDHDFYVPDAFSPNGDGENDRLLVYGNAIKMARLRIYNRIGEKLFESDNGTLNGWDGTYQSTPQMTGVYTYTVECVFLNNDRKTKTGTFTLIR